MSPAYDLLNTRLVIPSDSQALPVCGKRDRLQSTTWDELAARFRIGHKAALRVRCELRDRLPAAVALVENSPLPEDMRESYSTLLTQRAGLLA